MDNPDQISAHLRRISIIFMKEKPRIWGAVKNNSVYYIFQYVVLTPKFNLQAFIILAEERGIQKSFGVIIDLYPIISYDLRQDLPVLFR